MNGQEPIDAAPVPSPGSGSRNPMAWSLVAGDIRVTAPSAPALLDDMAARLRAGRGFSVATLNLDHVAKLRHDAAFRDAYRRQTHVTADGNPIVWLSWLAGNRVALVPGSDLVDPVAALAAREGWPVAFLGSTEATLATAAALLEKRHPGLRIAARLAPPMGLDPEGPEALAMTDAVAASEARLCILALGAPKQEILAARALERHPAIGFLSVGAGLDFVAGTQARAPAWMRAVTVEWLWRLLGNPSRLARRYAACAAILPGLALAALRHRMRPE